MTTIDSTGQHLARTALALIALAAISVTTAAEPVAANASASGDASKGKVLYQACAACHSIDGITWNDTTLDRWLVNPSALVPGTKMFFKIDDAQARADLIAYLKEQR